MRVKTQFSRIKKAMLNPSLSYQYILSEIYELKRQNLFDAYFVNGEKKHAVLIASYPKSGNTLFRLIWLNIINILELNQESVDFEILDEYLPSDQFYSDLKHEWKFSSMPCLLKTHRAYSSNFDPLRKVHLYRNPFDVMVSSYHYFSKRQSGPKNENLSYVEKRCFNSLSSFSGSFSDYLRENISSYCDHFISWSKNSTVGVRYESLIDKNNHVMLDVLSALNISINDDVILQAVNASERKNYRSQTSSKMASLKGMEFVRDGKKGQWKQYFCRHDMELLSRIFEEKNMFNLKNIPATYHVDLIDWKNTMTEYLGNQ